MRRIFQNMPLWVMLGIPSSILVFAFWYDLQSTNVNFYKWDKGVGVVTHVNYGRGSASEMEYFYKGQKYNCAGRMNCGRFEGEKYEIRINPQDPGDYMPLSWLPKFEESEETYEAIGTVTRVFKTWAIAQNVPKYALEYTFMIDQTEYEATQSLPPSYKNGTIKVGQQYLVQFGERNPPRSILHSELPVGKLN